MAIAGNKKIELTMDSILEKVSDYDIFRWYMPTKDWELNEITLSPFRREKNPSFIIGNKRGYVSFIDFGNTEFRGDCFTFVKKLYNLANLDEVLRKIDKDFGLGISSSEIKDYKKITGEYKQPEIVKRNTLIQVTTRKFTNEELAYWNTYHQDITDLRNNEIYSIKELYLNKKKFPLKDTDLRFGYFYDGFWKIYRPGGKKKEKWFPNNTPIHILDKKEAVKECNVALITKSKKDRMVLAKIYPCVTATQNEGIACFTPENIEYLKNNSKSQILLYDADVQGVKSSQQITELFNFGYCNVPKKYLEEGIKDFADLAKTHGIKAVEEVLKQKQLL